jgi:anti-sigma factor RsiW
VHLRTCAGCAARYAELRKRSATVGRWLDDLGVELPDPNKRAVALAAVERARFRSSATGPLGSGWMRAAAVFLLMTGFAFGTGTGRAWVAGAIVRLAGDTPPPEAVRLLEWLGVSFTGCPFQRTV